MPTDIVEGIRRAFTGAIQEDLARRFYAPLGEPFFLQQGISTVERLLECWVTDRAAVTSSLSGLPNSVSADVAVQRLACLVAPVTCLSQSAGTLEVAARGKNAFCEVPLFDSTLLQHVGFAPGTVTEVAGEAGTGKTHLGVHAALASVVSAVEHGLEKVKSVSCVEGSSTFTLIDLVLAAGAATAVYLAAESMPDQRLWTLAGVAATRLNNWMAESHAAAHVRALLHDADCARMRPVTEADVLSRVLVRKVVPGVTGLLGVLRETSTLFRFRPEVKIVVLDSIAAAMAACEDEAPPRAAKAPRSELQRNFVPRQLIHVGSELKGLACEFNVAIVVINQVRSNLHTDTIPALGPGWSSCVNTRIQLFHEAGRRDGGRVAVVASSSYLPSTRVAYRISDSGIGGRTETLHADE